MSPADAEVAALRARVAVPAWAWGTYAPGTFWTHVQLPSALAVQATLVRPSSGASLGAVLVFPNANPAVVRVQGHGYDGSTYTESSVSAWKGADCTTTLGSTVAAGGSLVLLATANGTACDDLALFVSFEYREARATQVTPSDAQTSATARPQCACATVFRAFRTRIILSARTLAPAPARRKSYTNKHPTATVSVGPRGQRCSRG